MEIYLLHVTGIYPFERFPSVGKFFLLSSKSPNLKKSPPPWLSTWWIPGVHMSIHSSTVSSVKFPLYHQIWTVTLFLHKCPGTSFIRMWQIFCIRHNIADDGQDFLLRETEKSYFSSFKTKFLSTCCPQIRLQCRQLPYMSKRFMEITHAPKVHMHPFNRQWTFRKVSDSTSL